MLNALSTVIKAELLVRHPCR